MSRNAVDAHPTPRERGAASKEILLTQRNTVELYPPVLHQAEILRQRHRVTILDLAGMEDSRTLTDASISRQRVGLTMRSGLHPILARARRDLGYRRRLRALLEAEPDVAIAFEPRAINIALSRKPSPTTRRIAHLHELPGGDESAGAAERAAVRRMWSNLRHADLVVVPDLHRARYVRAAARLPVTPQVVMNCPMRMERLPSSRLLPYLAERGAPTSQVVHYQGAVGPMKSLESIVSSMREWPPEAVFVIVGPGNAAYLDHLRRIAASHGTQHRIFFVGQVPYDQVLAFGVGAAVGMTMLEPAMPNWRFSAGASNKRFEYVALGVPQVAIETPGVMELFCRTGVASLASPTDPSSIAAAVNRYLAEPDHRHQVAARARALHLRQYNYETQFEPVAEWITRPLESRRHV